MASSKQLGDLRAQVQDLVAFFSDILAEVSLTVKGEVHDEFLEEIDGNTITDKQRRFRGVEVDSTTSNVSAGNKRQSTSLVRLATVG